MNVRVLIAFLLVSVVLAFLPRTRRIGLALTALCMALLVWVNIHEARQPDEPEPSIAKRSELPMPVATPSRINFISVQLSGRGAPWLLSGQLHNTGDVAIKWLRIHIERYDCPTVEAAVSECNSMWQGDHTARLAIPAGASVKVEESFYSHVAVPLVKGVTRDRIAIVDAG
jgi:hypothetical protein